MPNDEKKKLSIPEKIFVQELTKNGYKKSEAAKKAWPKASYPAQQAHRVLARPHVKKALIDILEEHYPEHNSDLAEVMKHGASLAKNTTDLAALTKYVDTMARLKGLAAPTQSQHMKAIVKLPGSE